MSSGHALSPEGTPPSAPPSIATPPGALTESSATGPEEALGIDLGGRGGVTHSIRLNRIRRLSKLIRAFNCVLPDGGLLEVRFETIRQRHRRIRGRFPTPIAQLYSGATFLIHRFAPKLPVTKQLYFSLTRGHWRVLSRCEVLGRLRSCHFEIESVTSDQAEVVVLARKTGNAFGAISPSWGPVFRMKRIGRGGKEIRVFKLRTMHPYAEYLQDYVYRHNHLAAGGKLADDFRVTAWGRLLRRYWIDELPMLLNWLMGDLKLVGVRPLSRHYETLYPHDLRLMRRRYKPGLIPPLYADLPRTFDEITASERAYLVAYAERPLRTDLSYLRRALANILIGRARSQ